MTCTVTIWRSDGPGITTSWIRDGLRAICATTLRKGDTVTEAPDAVTWHVLSVRSGRAKLAKTETERKHHD